MIHCMELISQQFGTVIIAHVRSDMMLCDVKLIVYTGLLCSLQIFEGCKYSRRIIYAFKLDICMYFTTCASNMCCG